MRPVGHSPPAVLTRAALLLAIGLFGSVSARADDPDNCLLCHQYRGLSRYDPQRDAVHLFYVSPDVQDQRLTPHARVACTDCHERAEVGVIPHRTVMPVDCTRQCHLQSVAGVARPFSHRPVAQMLDQSVHARPILDQLEFSGGPLLSSGQSDCLYCHDEPLFRDPGGVLAVVEERGAQAFDRCEVCHGERIPVDVRYYLRHVTSRIQPARPPLEMAQVCAVCHSDAKVRAQHDLPDTVASFVRSFHGKAALLGARGAADCISCHVRAGSNAHLMLAKDAPDSATHPTHVADSCRSTQCHPGADPAIAKAAVHLNLFESFGTLEYVVAACFVILTIFTFGPSLVLTLLELLQIVIGRHHEATHQNLQLTRAVLRHPDGPKRLERFTVSQRVQHWILALLFALLALTGFPMKFAAQHWARAVIDALGGLAAARTIHHWAGIALVTGFVAHVLYIFATMAQRMLAARKSGQPLSLPRAFTTLPLWISHRDGAKLMLQLAYLVGLRRDPPTYGRFSVKEKFEYIGVFWGTLLLGATGALLWGEQIASHFITGRVLNIALIAHTYEAFLAIIHVGILHICGVVFAPHVFPLSPATLSGRTPLPELAEAHSEFVQAAARDLGVAPAGGTSHE